MFVIHLEGRVPRSLNWETKKDLETECVNQSDFVHKLWNALSEVHLVQMTSGRNHCFAACLSQCLQVGEVSAASAQWSGWASWWLVMPRLACCCCAVSGWHGEGLAGSTATQKVLLKEALIRWWSLGILTSKIFLHSGFYELQKEQMGGGAAESSSHFAEGFLLTAEGCCWNRWSCSVIA